MEHHRLANMVVRCSPRGVQHTVRYNIVREVVLGMPVAVGMMEKTDDKTGRTYHALTTEQLVPNATTTTDTLTED